MQFVIRESDEIVTPVWPIESMPTFNQHLMRTGRKAVIDRIRYTWVSNPTKQPRSRNIPNTVLQLMQAQVPYASGPIGDIIEGIARLDHHQSALSKPLSVSRMYAILQTMPLINTREVSAMLAVDERQAQKYVKALKLCLFHIQRHLDSLTDVPEEELF
jgi:hypothetical protein